MTDLRTPDVIDPAGMIPEDELVAADDSIIGKAFLWSLVIFAVIGLAIGGIVFALHRPVHIEPVAPAAYVPAQSIEAPAVTRPMIPFTDVTIESGVNFLRDSGAGGEKLLPETMGGGCAFLDFDNDGNQDLLLVNGAPLVKTRNAPASLQPTVVLYRNRGRGQFDDVTSASGLHIDGHGMGVAVGDYDNDGDSDVFITTVGLNHLFRNDGGTFIDVTRAAGVEGDAQQWSTSAGFVDHDNDGDLDLFVCNYVQWSRDIDFAVNYQLTGVGRAYGPPTNFEATDSYLYKNNGNGTFTEISNAAGIRVRNAATGKSMGKALGVTFVDLDADTLPEIIVANDTVQNFLFHNRGGDEFTEIGAESGVAFDRNGVSTGAMGIDAVRYRNNKVLGIAIGNFANEMTSFYVSGENALQFTDEAISEGIGSPSRLFLKFGVLFLDADLDGRLDLLECNGHIEDEINVVQPSQHFQQPAQLFWNAGPEQKACFVELSSEQTGDLSRPIVGRGASYADIDADGDLDLLLTQPAGRPMLLRNDQAMSHHWLRIKLVGNGAASNRDAIGAWVEVTAGGIVQSRQVMPTRSYLSQVELPITFGLGDAASVESLTVRWPDGQVQKVSPSGIDRTIVIEQGKSASSSQGG